MEEEIEETASSKKLKSMEKPEETSMVMEESVQLKKKKKSSKEIAPVKMEIESDLEKKEDAVDRPKKKSKTTEDDEETKPEKNMTQAQEIEYLKEELEKLKKLVKTTNDSRKEQAPNVERKPWWIKPMDKETLDETKRRQHDRDSRSLYFNFVRTPTSTAITEEEFKGLAPDILVIKSRRIKMITDGWIYFADEEICKKNLKKLNGTKICGSELQLSRCRSGDADDEDLEEKAPKVPDEEKKMHTLKLAITCLPPSTTPEDLKKCFPTAIKIYRHHKKMPTNAFVFFDSPEITRQAFLNGKDATINGSKITVLYANAARKYDMDPSKSKKFHPWRS
jgi:hypothetical protein